MQDLLPSIHNIAEDVFVCQQDNVPSHRDFFRFPNVKCLQLTDKVGKFIIFWCQIFSGFYISLKSFRPDLWPSYSKSKKWTDFGGHSVDHIELDMSQVRNYDGCNVMAIDLYNPSRSRHLTVDNKPLKPSNIWQNLVGLSSMAFVTLCEKPGNDGKCWIFIGWVKMTERISAVSGSNVTESRSPFREYIVDWH